LIKTPAGRIFRRNRWFLPLRFLTFPASTSLPTGTEFPHPGPAQQDQTDPIPPPELPPPLPSLRQSARARQPRRVHFPNGLTQSECRLTLCLLHYFVMITPTTRFI
jgi:hypothetical protein